MAAAPERQLDVEAGDRPPDSVGALHVMCLVFGT